MQTSSGEDPVRVEEISSRVERKTAQERDGYFSNNSPTPRTAARNSASLSHLSPFGCSGNLFPVRRNYKRRTRIKATPPEPDRLIFTQLRRNNYCRRNLVVVPLRSSRPSRATKSFRRFRRLAAASYCLMFQLHLLFTTTSTSPLAQEEPRRPPPGDEIITTSDEDVHTTPAQQEEDQHNSEAVAATDEQKLPQEDERLPEKARLLLPLVENFCKCDQNRIFWPNYVHSMGYHCWRSMRKIADFHFVDAQQLFVENFRNEHTFDDVARSCPVGALNLATIVGSIYEAHDLGEQNYVDLQNWLVLWKEWAPAVIEYVESLDTTELDCRQVWDALYGHAATRRAGSSSSTENGVVESGREQESFSGGEEHHDQTTSSTANYDDSTGLGEVLEQNGDNMLGSTTSAVISQVPAAAEVDVSGEQRMEQTTGEVVEHQSSSHGVDTASESSTRPSSSSREPQVVDTGGHESEREINLPEEDEFLPFIFDVPRFTNMVKRMYRKLNAWQRLLYGDGEDTLTKREELKYEEYIMSEAEAATPEINAEQISGTTTQQAEDHLDEETNERTTSDAEMNDANSDKKSTSSLSLCMVYGNGARTFEHTLRTYKEMGLLDMAREKYLMFLEDADEFVDEEYEVEVEEDDEPAEETTSHQQPKVEEDAQSTRSTAEGVEVPGEEQMNSGEAAGDQEGQQNHGQHQSGELSSGTLPPPVRRRTKLLTRRIRNPELKWREHILRKYNLKQLPIHDYKWPETHIKISRTTYMRTGKAFASCAMRSTRSEFILFLEDDWEIISRPKSLVKFRLKEAMELLAEDENDDEQESAASTSSVASSDSTSSTSNSGARTTTSTARINRPRVDMVHLRHKLFYGPPYYELLTSVQHNEPPPMSLALYFDLTIILPSRVLLPALPRTPFLR
ncbi:unnamed protein product [Amoebophrya sp. A120]|nr:unnamed protein product [Amoebophrya sp. A120]|eukprot:GSA120T00013298001.1